MNDGVSRKFWPRCLGWFGGGSWHRLDILGLLICAIAPAIAGYFFASGNIMAGIGVWVCGAECLHGGSVRRARPMAVWQSVAVGARNDGGKIAPGCVAGTPAPPLD